ncbi:MAG: hypothetical protein HZB25_07675 [Candidatus Eisenbacteria bacterium]|nr:hypothetical protein [Candidatus Eisenbacteria bacterium]
MPARRSCAALGVAATAAAFLVAGFGLPAAAAAGGWRDMAGRWKLDPAHAQKPDTAISRGLKGMFFLAKPIAKGKLHRYLDPEPDFRLVLSGNADTLTLLYGKLHHFMIPEKGSYTSENPDEGHLERRDSWEGGVLESSNKSGEGTMIYKFVPDADSKRIELTLTIVSGKLNGPVSGKYEYVRE